MSKRISDIKAFWDARARQHGADWRATLAEEPLRRLEIATMAAHIEKSRPRLVLDIGCGNGYSTAAFSRRFPETRFIGVDYSEEMINVANKNRAPNCTFTLGDVLRSESLPDKHADLVFTQRCIQNLPDYESQKTAISNLRSRLSKGGVLLLMECSKDGVLQLNRMRRLFLKKPIEDIEPWHNEFLVDQNLVRDFSAKVVHFSSTYMFISRLLHPRLSGLGASLPNIGAFGYERLYVIAPEP